MKYYFFVFWLNSLCILLVITLSIYATFLKLPIGLLFLPPVASPYPIISIFTHTFQLLCTVPVILCSFSFGLLVSINPRHPANKFILGSALLTGGFLVNEIFRIHIYLLAFAGVPKMNTSALFGFILLLYGLGFWRQIQSTPYLLLITGFGLLFIAILVDWLHLKGNDIPALLEGVPKLFSQLNISIYYWLVCQREVKRSLNSSYYY